MSADTIWYQQGDLSKDPQLTNDNTINIIIQYIKHIPLDAYVMGQNRLHQNFISMQEHVYRTAVESVNVVMNSS